MTDPATHHQPHYGDEPKEFTAVVSLMAALESAPDHPEHRAALVYVTLARTEVTDFGQRPPGRLFHVEVESIEDGLAELDAQLADLQATSTVLHHVLRIEAARGLVSRARAELG